MRTITTTTLTNLAYSIARTHDQCGPNAEPSEVTLNTVRTRLEDIVSDLKIDSPASLSVTERLRVENRYAEKWLRSGPHSAPVENLRTEPEPVVRSKTVTLNEIADDIAALRDRIEEARVVPRPNLRGLALAVTKLDEAILWLSRG